MAGGGNVLGDAYEYLINQFADDAGKKGSMAARARPFDRLRANGRGPATGRHKASPYKA